MQNLNISKTAAQKIGSLMKDYDLLEALKTANIYMLVHRNVLYCFHYLKNLLFFIKAILFNSKGFTWLKKYL